MIWFNSNNFMLSITIIKVQEDVFFLNLWIGNAEAKETYFLLLITFIMNTKEYFQISIYVPNSNHKYYFI